MAISERDREARREELERLLALRQSLPWIPQKGPQALAFASTADQILFGGQAGGGKSDLLIGLAMLKHKRSLLLRREFKELSAIQTRISEINGGTKHYRAGEQEWRFPSGHVLELGSAPNVGDESKFQGRPHNALLIDEGANFAESQIEFLTGWLRDVDGGACQLVVASNPPLSGEGQWLIDWWRPWLDPAYPNPAESGEIRYFGRIGSKMTEVEPSWRSDRGARPISRTFIRSSLEDNRYLRATGYADRLDQLPDHLRAALRDGDFMMSGQDKALQVIPSQWVSDAQRAWTPDGGEGLPITQIGVDCSRGGRDRTVIIARHRHWVAPPIVLEREETRSGGSVAAHVLRIMGDAACRVHVDVVGIGASVYDHLHAYIGGLAIPEQAAGSAQGGLNADAVGYANRRAQLWFNARDQLDPAHRVLQLPPDTNLFTELCQPTYTINARGYLVQSKEAIIKEHGRSPDVADALLLALAD